MKELIDVFKMDEISIQTRIKIIIRLGSAINDRYAMNITEALVYELVKALDPENKDVEKEHYLKAL